MGKCQRWDPYGLGHQVLRTAIDCAGCQLIDCVERARECPVAGRLQGVAGLQGTSIRVVGMSCLRMIGLC